MHFHVPALQVAALPRLAELMLFDAYYDRHSYSPLTQLTGLTRLHLVHCRHVPACLSQLTGLKALACEDARADDIQPWETVLPRLTRLTFLALTQMSGQLSVAPLASLTNLRSLYWQAGNVVHGTALPSGPWLAGLRRLFCSPTWLLEASLPALAGGAQQLELLVLRAFEDGQVDATERIIHWAAGRPSMRKVLLVTEHGRSGQMPFPVCAAALEAQRRRPDMLVQPDYYYDDHCFLDPDA